MDKTFIARKLVINTNANNVWRVFTDPSITRQMGGEYITDWKAGSSFSWQGTDGNIYTHGTILEVEPAKILKHTLFNPEEEETILSVITYRMEESKGVTTLFAREDLTIDMTEKEYEAAAAGWEFALNLVREKAESLAG